VHVIVAPPTTREAIETLVAEHPDELGGLTCPQIENFLINLLEVFVDFFPPPHVP
jgi:hypothetical protein